MGKKVTATFNIFEHGRSNHSRSYDLANVRQVLESAQTKERIAMREAYGYYGHGRRQVTGKLNIGEFETIQTPAGALILENVPALVTTRISIDDDGTVQHEQEFLDTDPGRAALALYESKVGGFSWAMGGRDGGRSNLSRVTGYHGMDYVLEPGFAKNRGFRVGIMESAGTLSDDEEQAILESMMAAGLDEQKALAYRETFFNPYLLVAELHQRNEEAVNAAADLENSLEEMRRKNEELQAQMERERLEREEMAGARREALLSFAKNMHFAVSPQILESLKNGDTDKELMLFESILRESSKLSRLPIAGKSGQPAMVPAHPGSAAYQRDEPPEYGSIDAAPRFD
ncbi:MAG: hypothetical protein IBX50_12420 [Marinospirillum sp.]|uniref:hypothetical protein n=1 Tax=Marinospirillum sp. TaxID=2183934 RepID=UPI0019F6892B|nr:hypothetical protein [Marinospirillum sp.]MBE0507501.1 hypothetical protein [Marinospirillum sp.]